MIYRLVIMLKLWTTGLLVIDRFRGVAVILVEEDTTDEETLGNADRAQKPNS